MKRNTYRKPQSLGASKPSCKEKPKKYARSPVVTNPAGLGFPDNFMALIGWRRVG